MRSLLHFIKYNNAVPLILSVLILGTGATFAASPKLREAVLPNQTVQPFGAPKAADTSNLMKADLDSYDISVRIDTLTENTEAYAVEYSYNTYDIVDGIWQETRKSRRMDIPKVLLGKRKLTDYLSEQIGQVVHQELAYLDDVRKTATGENIPKPRISKYAGLAGKEIAVSDGAPSGVGETKETPSDTESKNTGTQSSSVGLSKEEVREMIVQAVADFLAIDTSMPETIVETPTETTLEEPQTKPESESESETEETME